MYCEVMWVATTLAKPSTMLLETIVVRIIAQCRHRDWRTIMIDLRNLHLIQQKQLTASANKRIMQLTSIHDVLTTLVERIHILECPAHRSFRIYCQLFNRVAVFY
jgi:hypothetical protein